MSGGINYGAKLCNLSGVALETVTHVGMFLIFFPRRFIEDVVVEETNSTLENATNIGEFLRYIGIWLIITKACPGKMSHNKFWSHKPVSRKTGAPFRLYDLMSGMRFNEIIQSLSFTSENPSQYRDPFWEVHEFIRAWNANMTDNFVSGWINCLDESMSI